MKDKQPGAGSSESRAGKGGDKNWPHNQKKSAGKDDRNTCHNCGKKGHWAKD
jgi:hypothetical protein